MPTITHNMPFKEYCDLPGINSHSIMKGVFPLTIKHMVAEMANNSEVDKKDWKLGRAIHTKILEPDTFDQQWKVSLPCAGVFGHNAKKANEVCGRYSTYYDGIKWYCGQHCGEAQLVRDCIDESELTRVRSVEQELKQVGHLAQFRRKGWSEVVIQFDLYGHQCKARLDRLPEDMSLVIDLKKVKPGKANHEAFSKQAADLCYHVQAWFYCEAVKAISGSYPSFMWVIVEDDIPHCVNSIMASNLDLKVGRHLGATVLKQLTDLTEKGICRGYIDRRIPTGVLPKWYCDRYREIELGDDLTSDRDIPF